MLPVSLIFTSGVASGVNSYAAVLVLGLLGRFGHIAAIPPVLERPSVLAAAAALYIGQFVVGKIPMLDSVWDVVHTALRPVVGGAVGVVMAQHAQANSAATIAAAALGGGAALASHVVKTSMRVGINASPEPFSNIVASLLEDLGVIGLVSFAVFHPVAAATVASVVLAAGITLIALLASRIRRGWRRRRDARLRRRSSGDRMAGGGLSLRRQDVTLPTGPATASRAATSRLRSHDCSRGRSLHAPNSSSMASLTPPRADRSAAVSPMGEMAARQEARPGTGSLFCGCGSLSFAAGDASRQDVHDGVSCGCPMILAASARARRGGGTNAWT